MNNWTKNEKENIVLLARQIVADPSLDLDLFCRESKHFSDLLPDSVLETMRNFALSGSPSGIFVTDFQPFLTEEIIPDTPITNQKQIGSQTLLAKIQSLLIHAMNADMIAYEAEGYGHLFQDVVPIKAMAENQTSNGSHKELEIHTEQAFSKLRPDILSLACLRGDPKALTHILPVSDIVDHLLDFQKDLLFQPLWRTGVDLSFKLHGVEFLEGDVRGPLSILEGSKEDPQLIFDQDLMTGITEEAAAIIQSIVDIYYTHRRSHCLKPGEILFLDNRRAVHGRSPFFPKYDGMDRFLVRCFAVLDYEKTRYARENGGRVVGAVYS
jgi:L-asparagine oxygenase